MQFCRAGNQICRIWSDPVIVEQTRIKLQRYRIWRSQRPRSKFARFRDFINFQKPFSIHVDASDHTVAGILTQPGEDRAERPVEFISSKLYPTQVRWSSIEKETYATVWALKKFRRWIFGKSAVVYIDHNPITYLTDVAPKSAKLMRWALAIQDSLFGKAYKTSFSLYSSSADQFMNG